MTSLIDLYAERSCSNSLGARGAKPIEDIRERNPPIFGWQQLIEA